MWVSPAGRKLFGPAIGEGCFITLCLKGSALYWFKPQCRYPNVFYFDPPQPKYTCLNFSISRVLFNHLPPGTKQV